MVEWSSSQGDAAFAAAKSPINTMNCVYNLADITSRVVHARRELQPIAAGAQTMGAAPNLHRAPSIAHCGAAGHITGSGRVQFAAFHTVPKGRQLGQRVGGRELTREPES